MWLQPGVSKLSPELSELVVYTCSVPFKGFEQAAERPASEMSSFSESKALRLIKDSGRMNPFPGCIMIDRKMWNKTSLPLHEPAGQTTIGVLGTFSLCLCSSCLGINFVRHNSHRLSRIYPSGQRLQSSNYNPQDMWNGGCQIGEGLVLIL